MPNDLPPWYIVYQQTQRWLAADCFAAIVDDLHLLLREAKGHDRQPSAAILDSRTLQSTPESGSRAGWEGLNPLFFAPRHSPRRNEVNYRLIVEGILWIFQAGSS